MQQNILLNTDSYKASHFCQYPEGTTAMYSYIESRGGEYQKTVMFGLQYILKEYLTKPITREMVKEAAEVWAAHGEPFDEEGFMYIVENYNGYFPISIDAIPEGMVVPTKVPLVTVECQDPRVFWLGSYFETLLLRVWYPITVATQSWHIKQVITDYLELTSDDPSQVMFKLHDFGARGASSLETAAIGGAAHLVNFMGSDTMAGILLAKKYYNEPMAGFSIPAAEHSTITSWGRENEEDAYRNMIKQFGRKGAIFAVVSDSYDIFNAVEKLWGEALKDEVIASEATLVVRPDSGEPTKVVLQVLNLLEKKFGTVKNSKGFKVLNNVRVIQGDGVNIHSIHDILAAMKVHGFAADNVAFGMGGALLQQVNRDTLKFAMKCSAVRVNGEWRDVYKDPITDPGKTSKKGRVETVTNGTDFQVITAEQEVPEGYWPVMNTVYHLGTFIGERNFSDIRALAAASRGHYSVPAV